MFSIVGTGEDLIRNSNVVHWFCVCHSRLTGRGIVMLSIRNRIHVIQNAAGISEFMSQEIKLVLKREVP